MATRILLYFLLILLPAEKIWCADPCENYYSAFSDRAAKIAELDRYIESILLPQSLDQLRNRNIIIKAKQLDLKPEKGDLRVGELDPNNAELPFTVIASQHGMIDISNYNEGRGFLSYLRAFQIEQNKAGLAISLGGLRSDSHMIDLGAGQMQFIKEYLSLNNITLTVLKNELQTRQISDLTPLIESINNGVFPNFTGITVSKEMRGAAPQLRNGKPINIFEELPHKIQLLRGRYFETIPSEEILEKFGQADLITDFFGVFAYTFNLPLVIKKVAEIMKPGAELWIVKNKQIINVDNALLDLDTFLGSIKGFELVKTKDLTTDSFLIKRTTDPIQVPKMILMDARIRAPMETLWKVVDPDFHLKNP